MRIQRKASMVAAAALTLGALTMSVAAAGAGKAWTIVPSPNHGSDQVGFSSISCTSTRFCIGVGSDSDTTETKPFSAMWNGTKWNRLQNPAGVTNRGRLGSVSCVSPSWCVAVGELGLVEVWNGQKWTVDAAKSPGAAGSELNGVSCISKTWCVAVGLHVDMNAESNYAVVEWWNGKTWALMNAADNSGTSVRLYGISCTSTKFCAAAGFSSPPGQVPEPDSNLVELWNGSRWSNSETPDRAVFDNDLNSISCTTRSSCTAVGDSFASNTDKTYKDSTAVMAWNGTKWSFAATPNIGNFDTLSGVVCSISHLCVAVGNYGPESNLRTLIEWSNGGKWGLVKSPNGAGTSSLLSSVSCFLPSWCEAVGSTGQGYMSKTLAVRYG